MSVLSDTELMGVIDVCQIYSKLDGISINTKALQETTFETTSGPTTGNENSTRHHANQEWDSGLSIPTKPYLSCSRCDDALIPATEDQSTIMLAEDESYHLAMHAGHTPRHYLSLVPAMTAAESNGGRICSRNGMPAVLTNTYCGAGSNCCVNCQLQLLAGAGLGVSTLACTLMGHGGPGYDTPVSRSSVIENLPEHDESFWAEVSQRLEQISHAEQALPKVLKLLPYEPANIGA
ncbi:hypothetical protein VFPPC_12386 [Pochonia chlamydosporia 170]|uniref:Uncharacterized protein n=1 Tax=Pochonia chlamydosporia 170 TaxID=1380566 RepID=A0A179EZ98_METCM|nr:hypothetical protein VFPPC_12386 [Pochonia chlamydosporia 170]OAQ58163.1 hypothetical protein VFPPC_12386 [Pochonia chlamydosporia 170]